MLSKIWLSRKVVAIIGKCTLAHLLIMQSEQKRVTDSNVCAKKSIVKSETHQTTPNAPYPIGRSGCTS